MFRLLVGIMSVLMCLLNSNGFIIRSAKRINIRKSFKSTMVASSSSSSISVSELTAQMKEMREELAKDEQAQLMLAALRGSNSNDDDFATDGVTMRLVDVRKGSDSLPKIYDPDALDAYFDARPGAVLTRFSQLLSVSSGFLGSLLWDAIRGKIAENDVKRAGELRDIISSLGPFFIKLGQALSIRPDILSPKAMVELQRLCDKVPSFDTKIAMALVEEEYGCPVEDIFSELTPEPVAAASLGQVYKGRLKSNGDQIALKVQRPMVLETVSLDLYLLRKIGFQMRKIKFLADRTDLVGILDEFAARFFEELDYRLECENGIIIRENMKGIKNVIVPKNYPEWTTRKAFVTEWIDGEKLSQSTADDVQDLVNVGVVAYLTQLLDTGFFHADPHPGNLIRTPEGKLCLLDFGLMTKITDDQKYGMIEAISHLVHRDYKSIGDDFVKLDFIPRDVDITPIIPALTKVFDAALSGGGAKSINFQDLAADLAQITFEYPFRIPPYFALVIRAIGVLEGIALVGNPDFAIVDEAYPYISKRLLTDDSPRLKAALRYMVYGQTGVFDIERMLDLLQALESFNEVANEVDRENITEYEFDINMNNNMNNNNNLIPVSDMKTREALNFFFSDEGSTAREFLLEEVVKSVDALSRNALWQAAEIFGIPLDRLPGAALMKAAAPKLNDADRVVLQNANRLITFFSMANNDNDDNNNNNNNNNLNNFGGLALVNSNLFPPSPFNLLLNLNNNFNNRNGNNNLIRTQQQQSDILGIPADRVSELNKLLVEFGPAVREFGLLVIARLVDRTTSRILKATGEGIFGRA